MTTCNDCKFFRVIEGEINIGTCFAYPPDVLEVKRWVSFFTCKTNITSARAAVNTSDVSCVNHEPIVPTITIVEEDFLRQQPVGASGKAK